MSGSARSSMSIWKSPAADMRTKQRLVRALIEEIVVDVDDERREVILVIHWKGGQHSELRIRKPQPGEHTMRNAPETIAGDAPLQTRGLSRFGAAEPRDTFPSARVRGWQGGRGLDPSLRGA